MPDLLVRSFLSFLILEAWGWISYDTLQEVVYIPLGQIFFWPVTDNYITRLS